MTLDRATDIIGINTTRDNTTSMVIALGFFAYRNTPEENERREAGKYVLRRWSQYQAECNRMRDRK